MSGSGNSAVLLNISLINVRLVANVSEHQQLIYIIKLSIAMLLFAVMARHTIAETVNGLEHNRLDNQQQLAALIRNTFETQIYALRASKYGHYGLRMFRQTRDLKYKNAVWADLARVASKLNKIAATAHTPEQIAVYSATRLANYKNSLTANGVRKKLRYNTTQAMPEYFYLGVDLIGAMARANEYGLQHREDKKLRTIIRRYDFRKYSENKPMIRAWAAQLANQVYWLRQLGEQDVVDGFIKAFRSTYPDDLDAKLSPQQYINKIYGLTHIIFADSHYYQYPIREKKYAWIFDYYRNNIDAIIARTTEDVVAEVGVNFLLAGLDNDPVVTKIRQHIQNAVNLEKGMIPTSKGSFELELAEHRNVLAIMLLDWKTPKASPKLYADPEVFRNIPFGLIAKTRD